MDIMIVKKVFIWDSLAQKYRITKFRLDKVTEQEIIINGIVYHRKGTKRIGRVIETRISTNNERMVGRIIPIYA